MDGTCDLRGVKIGCDVLETGCGLRSTSRYMAQLESSLGCTPAVSLWRKETDTVEAVIYSLGLALPSPREHRNDFTYIIRLSTNYITQALSHRSTKNSLPSCFYLRNHYPPRQFTSTVTMGWLPWSSNDSTKASDGGRIAPDRSSRARCWEGRDAFFACLDRNNILDAIKDDKEARRKCAKEVAEFEAACSQTWVCS